jgi:hypothetical protein
MGALASLFPIGIGFLLTVGLLVVGALRHNAGAFVAALAIIGGGYVGNLIAPGASGSTMQAEGSAMAGTPADPAALWSGPVTCEWPKDRSTTIRQVRGFEVPVADSEFLASEELRDVVISIVNIDGSVFYEGVRTDAGWTQAGEFPVELDSVSADGRNGTAVFPRAGGIVFSWSCASGP